MKRIIIFSVIAMLAIPIVRSQDSAYARYIIKTLSSDQMYGRGFCHHGDSIAARFLASEMKHLGLLPLQVDYMQHYNTTFPSKLVSLRRADTRCPSSNA